MRDAGLVDEVRTLRERGALSRTAAQAIGYREILEHLHGNMELDAALDAIVVRTRQFARRQRMWFRRDPRITWFASPDNSCTVLPALLASWSA
jgi:tRNA dimethylallyltransferase